MLEGAGFNIWGGFGHDLGLDLEEVEPGGGAVALGRVGLHEIGRHRLSSGFE
jgi:hypothetical protein